MKIISEKIVEINLKAVVTLEDCLRSRDNQGGRKRHKCNDAAWLELGFA